MDNKERIIKIYNDLDRSYFMEEYKEYAHEDSPFPIGHGQTISQPSLVLQMTILLDVDKNSKVLEIGTGSGYQTAILSQAAKEVYTVERIEDLFEKAKKRLDEAGYKNIKFKLADANLGWEENAPYDRIMVTAAPADLPEELVDQLAPMGRMIVPVGAGLSQDLLLIKKDKKGKIEKETITKVRFVKLIEEN